MTSLLQIDKLRRNFGGVLAVDDVTITLASGSIQGLIGPNGSGKTTLFNCLSGVYRPTGGRLIFDGQRIDRLPPHRIVARGIARTFQNLRLFGGMTALENVLVSKHLSIRGGMWSAMIGSRGFHREESASLQQCLELLEFCGLAGRENARANELPYGGQRRLEIARALAAGPRLLLLDEPSSGMNRTEADALKALIRQIRDRGITVFVIEHNVRLVMDLCDRIAVMNGGRLIAEDTPTSVAQNHAVIEAYLGQDTDDD